MLVLVALICLGSITGASVPDAKIVNFVGHDEEFAEHLVSGAKAWFEAVIHRDRPGDVVARGLRKVIHDPLEGVNALVELGIVHGDQTEFVMIRIEMPPRAQRRYVVVGGASAPSHGLPANRIRAIHLAMTSYLERAREQTVQLSARVENKVDREADVLRVRVTALHPTGQIERLYLVAPARDSGDCEPQILSVTPPEENR